MSAAASAFAPSRGLYPVKKKPSEDSESQAIFVDMVWDELTPTSFKNIGEFEEWFENILLPRVVNKFEDRTVGLLMIETAFPHGGVQHFTRWVMMNFTTTKSPEEARELREWKWKTRQPQGFYSPGLYVVTRKPSEDSETKAVFVSIVWGQITNTPFFKNIEEFKEWFKPLFRRVVSDFGEDPTLGLRAIQATFGGITPFMIWVMTKFTTTTSPVAATATQRRRAQRELKKTTKSQEFILPGRSVKKMCPDGVERYVPEEPKKAKKRSAKEIAAMREYGKTKVVISLFPTPEEQFACPTRVTRELLAPRNGTTTTIQDLSDFLTTTAFDALVEQLSGMPFSQKGWRQYLVNAFCRKKVILSEENYEEEFQQKLREIKGRYGNWVIDNFTAPARTVAKKSKSPRWDIVDELRKGSNAYEGSAASKSVGKSERDTPVTSVAFVGDASPGKSFKRQDMPLRAAMQPGQVVFENCTPEEALLALWKEAGVLGFGWLQQDGNPPTLEECREAANRGYVDYLKGKPIKTKFRSFPVLETIGYDYDNGAGKMQRVADMLRAKKTSASKASASGGAGEGKTESNAPVTLSAAEPVVVAEVVEVIPLAEAVAVPVSEEGYAPMAPMAPRAE